MSVEEGVSAAGTWVELAVTADREAVEQVSEILSRACAGGVSVEEPFELVDEGLGARIDSTRPVVVRGYVTASDRAASTAAVERVRRDLGHLQAFGLRPIADVATRLIEEEDWAGAWKQNFQVQRIGHRIVIQPSWREHEAKPGEVVIKLDPGMAFGTGLHPTTRLCLAGIERWADTDLLGDANVLDVGTGSGILAICAAAFGASSVLAIDTDPLSVETAARNAELNGFADLIHPRAGSLPLAESREFHLVVANLVASVLVNLAPELASALRPGGRLLASGVFRQRDQEVTDAFGAAGLEVIGRGVEGDWLALEALRPG